MGRREGGKGREGGKEGRREGGKEGRREGEKEATRLACFTSRQVGIFITNIGKLFLQLLSGDQEFR